MKHNKRAKKPILRILFGLFCFLLLAFLLYATQFFASCYLQYDNAMSELSQIRDALSSENHTEEIAQAIEEFYKQDLQKTALLLSDEELSNEKLAAVMEGLLIADEIIILENGAIAERGTHQSLLAQKGLYYKTYLAQYGE